MFGFFRRKEVEEVDVCERDGHRSVPILNRFNENTGRGKTILLCERCGVQREFKVRE